MGAVICFYITITLCGVMAYPLSLFLFKDFSDRGFQASKVLGALIPSYFVWLLSTLGAVRFSFATCILFTAIFGVICWVLFFILKKKDLLSENLPGKDEIIRALILEAVFIALFAFFTYLRCFKPGADSTEKFMDYGFVASFMRSDCLPVNDIWYSGEKLNYYYFGQYFTAFLLKLSGVDVSVGYNLMLSLLGAFAFTLPYTLVSNLLRDMKRGTAISRLGGTMAGLCVSIAGNMHYVLYRAVFPFFCRFFGVEDGMERLFHYPNTYSFSNSTRYIGYYPDVPDKTIHEMPSYSLVLGDLHAHFINIIFVLTFVLILYAWVNRQEKKAAVHIGLLALLLGVFSMTNYWDMPIYFVVAGAVIMFETLIRVSFKAKGLLFTGICGVFIFAGAQLFALPFTLNFSKMFAGIGSTTYRSPFYQILVLWGLPIAVSIFFIVVLVRETKRSKSFKSHKNQGFFRFMTCLEKPDLFILLISLCAMGLILMPELIFVRDIYGDAYQRANTMFKLTYQAFILFGCVMGYVIFRPYEKKKGAVRVLRVVFSIFIVSTFFYFFKGCNEWFSGWGTKQSFKGIVANEFLKDRSRADYDVVKYINENVEGQAVILEGTSDSYTDGGRISAMTGCQTVIGWRTHEWLWRSDETLKYPDDEAKRVSEVDGFYTNYTSEQCYNFINKYKIDYIYVGDYERNRYNGVNDRTILQLGEIVFASDGSYLIKVYR